MVRTGLAVIVVGAFALVGCTQPTTDRAADPADWRRQVVEFTDAHGPVVVPARLPERLSQAQPLTLEGQPAVTFYGPGEPLVTVCSGDVQRCRTALGTSREVRTGRADGHAFVVALGAPEEPASTPTLSAASRSFWADVPMTSSRPSWAAGAGQR